MSKTASRTGARVLIHLCDKASYSFTQDPGTFFSKLAARPSLKTPTRHLLDVAVARRTCASKTLEKKEEVFRWNQSRAHWARQVGAWSAWFLFARLDFPVFAGTLPSRQRPGPRPPNRHVWVNESCVNLALRSWNKVEVLIKHRVYGVRVPCLFLLLFLLSFFFFFSFLHFLETGQNPPPPNGHARILANADIYGRSLR